MRVALDEATLAIETGDVPVGAVIVQNGVIVAKAHNTKEKDMNALWHAEVSAINKACDLLGNWRLDDCDLYVTLEPCMMCTGAIVESRIRRVFFGAYDKRYGFIASNDIDSLNKKFEYYCGIMEEECTELLKDFFGELRK